MTWDERLIWIVWISLMYVLFGVAWAVVHFGNMLVYAGGINYLREKYP